MPWRLREMFARVFEQRRKHQAIDRRSHPRQRLGFDRNLPGEVARRFGSRLNQVVLGEMSEQRRVRLGHEKRLASPLFPAEELFMKHAGVPLRAHRPSAADTMRTR